MSKHFQATVPVLVDFYLSDGEEVDQENLLDLAESFVTEATERYHDILTKNETEVDLTVGAALDLTLIPGKGAL